MQPPAERCYWVVPAQLLAGAYPGSADAGEHEQRITALYAAGMRTFVSLMEPDERDGHRRAFVPYADRLERFSTAVSCVRFPIRDLSVPTVAEMRSILDAIDASLAALRPVYLHCFGGIGRTGTVVGCWLIRHQLAAPENVLEVLCELRRADRARSDRRAPELDAQVRFVRAWREE